MAQDHGAGARLVRRPCAFLVAGIADAPQAAAADLAERLSPDPNHALPVMAPGPLALARLRHNDAILLGAPHDNDLAFDLWRRGLMLGAGRLEPADFVVRTLSDPLRTGANVLQVDAGGESGWLAAVEAIADSLGDGLLGASVLGAAPGLPRVDPDLPLRDALLESVSDLPGRTAAVAAGAAVLFYWTDDARWADLGARCLEHLFDPARGGTPGADESAWAELAPWLAVLADCWGWLEPCEAIEDGRAAAIEAGWRTAGERIARRLAEAEAGLDLGVRAGCVLALVRLAEQGLCEAAADHEADRLIDAWADVAGPIWTQPTALWLAARAGLAVGRLDFLENGLVGQAAEAALCVHDPNWRLATTAGDARPFESGVERAAWLGLLRLSAWHDHEPEHHWAAGQIEATAARQVEASWPEAMIDPLWILSHWTHLHADVAALRPEGERCVLAPETPGKEQGPGAALVMMRGGGATQEYLLLDGGSQGGARVLRFCDHGRPWVVGSSVRVGRGDGSNAELATRCEAVEQVLDLPKLAIVRLQGRETGPGEPGQWTRTVVWYKGQFVLFLDTAAPGRTLDLAWDAPCTGAIRARRWTAAVGDSQFRIAPAGGGPLHAEALPGGAQRVRQQWSSADPEVGLLAATLMVAQQASRPKRWTLRRTGDTGVAVVGKNDRVFVFLNGPSAPEFTSDAALCYVDGQDVILTDFEQLRIGDFRLRSYLPLRLAMNLRDGAGEIRASQSTTVNVSAREPAGVSLDGQIIWRRQSDPEQAVVLTPGVHTFAASTLVGHKVRLADGLRRG